MYKCQSCDHVTKNVLKELIPNKYNFNDHQCENYGFIQTNEPLWLDEAYQNAITSLDLGINHRNLHFSIEIEKLINHCFKVSKEFLNYGGGNGVHYKKKDLNESQLNFDHYIIKSKFFGLIKKRKKKI
jgi:hypothetical protein